MKEIERRRISWIDVARGLLIFSIVLGHTLTTGKIRFWIYSFHVPAFFFLSGYCHNSQVTFKEFLMKKIKGIIIPYFSFSLISIAVFGLGAIIYTRLTQILNCNPITNIIEMLYGNSKNDLMKYNSPLWFLPCLFIVSILACLAVKLSEKSKKPKLILCIILFACIVMNVFLNGNDSFALPWHAETACSMLFWYMLGIEFKNCGIFDRVGGFCYVRKHNRLMMGFVAALLLVAGAIIASFNIRSMGVREEHYGIIPIYYSAALLGILGIVCMGISIKHSKIAECLGRKTIVICCVHKFPILVFQKFIPKTAKILEKPDTISGIVVAVIISVLVISFSMLASYLIKKYLPWLLGKKHVAE